MPEQPSATRQHYLDWLRVLSILVVFIFHSGRFFDPIFWHVKNPHTYPAVQIWTSFLAVWMMPLIFVISGASTFLALGSRVGAEFIRERVLRLLVPLIVGIFTHVAVQVYLERLSHHQFNGSFFDFYPRYFQGLYTSGGNFAWFGMHLWYLEALFIFSVIFLPLLLWLKRQTGRRLLEGLGNLVARPGVIYLLAVPVILLLACPNPATFLTSRDWGGWSLVAYIPFFLNGYLIVSHAGIRTRIQNSRWLSLGMSAVVTIVVMGLWVSEGEPVYGSLHYTVLFSLFALAAWCWILAIWGFGMKHLNFDRPLLKYANEGVLPFYVMHQTVLLCVGYFVVPTNLPDLLKAIVISSSSFVLIAAAYEYAIRRNNVLRFLFGMKPRRLTRPVEEVPTLTPVAR